MVTWGIISAAFMIVSSAPMFYALRFLLGVAEAGFYPGIILYLTYWYLSHRRAKIIAVFMSAIPISGIFGNPFRAGSWTASTARRASPAGSGCS